MTTPRVAALAALLVVIGTIVAGCSGGRGAVAAAVPAARPPSVRCGEAAVVGPWLRPVQAHMLSLPGTPDGVATTLTAGHRSWRSRPACRGSR